MAVRAEDWSSNPTIVVGGGPSLRDFPWPTLIGRPPGVRVIAVNAAMRDVPNADVFFTEDTRFVEQFSKADWWKAFAGRKIVHALTEGFAAQLAELDPTVEIIRKIREDKFWAKSLDEGLSFSSNSGIGAMNLADLFGAPTIYLLGFDCTAGPRFVENYHTDLYPKDWAVGSNQAESYRSDFTHWVAPHLRHKVVVNVVNPAAPSALECWPTLRYGNFLYKMSLGAL